LNDFSGDEHTTKFAHIQLMFKKKQDLPKTDSVSDSVNGFETGVHVSGAADSVVDDVDDDVDWVKVQAKTLYYLPDLGLGPSSQY